METQKKKILSIDGLKVSNTGIIETGSVGLIEIRDDELLDEIYGGVGDVTINFYCPHHS